MWRSLERFRIKKSTYNSTSHKQLKKVPVNKSQLVYRKLDSWRNEVGVDEQNAKFQVIWVKKAGR